MVALWNPALIKPNLCSWDGVTCADGHVIGVQVRSSLLSSIPREIEALTRLNRCTFLLPNT